MRIICPSCTAAYEVADSLVVPGRIVRCARCGEEWVALTAEAPLPDEAEPELQPYPEPINEPAIGSPRLSAMDRLAQAAPRRAHGGLALRAAWAASIAAVLMLLWGAYAWRSAVMHGWPPSIRLYDALGLAAPRPH